MSGGGADGDLLAAHAAETALIADLEAPAETVADILGGCRRAGLDGRITVVLCAALVGFGASAIGIYGIGRGDGPRYEHDHELTADAAGHAAAFAGTAARLRVIITETEQAQARARDYENAAAAAAEAARQLPPGTPGGHLATARDHQWAAACRISAAEEILGPARGAVAALEFAVTQLEQIPDLLTEVYEPHYEIMARPGGRLPSSGGFITGQDPAGDGYGQAEPISLRLGPTRT